MCRLLLATRKCPHIDSEINIYLCTAALARKPEQACPIAKKFCSICQCHSINDEAQALESIAKKRIVHDHNGLAIAACKAGPGTTGTGWRDEGRGKARCEEKSRQRQSERSMTHSGPASMPTSNEQTVDDSDEGEDVVEEVGRADLFKRWKRDRERAKAMKMFEVKEKTVRTSTRFEID